MERNGKHTSDLADNIWPTADT